MIAGSADPAIGQSVRVSVPEENFRKEPSVTSSNRLATVFEGAVLKVESRQGRWVHATLEGWIWSPSVSATDRDGFNLIVSNPGGRTCERLLRVRRGELAGCSAGCCSIGSISRETGCASADPPGCGRSPQ